MVFMHLALPPAKVVDNRLPVLLSMKPPRGPRPSWHELLFNVRSFVDLLATLSGWLISDSFARLPVATRAGFPVDNTAQPK